MIIFLSIVVGIIIILFLITIHELGHFLISKLFHVYVYEFAIGFGPKIFSWQPKETKYSIRLFPFGGYVHTASKYTEPPKNQEHVVFAEKRFFESKKFYQKILIIFAGVLINFLCAAFLLTFGFLATGYSPNDLNGYGQHLIVEKNKSGKTYASNQIYDYVSHSIRFKQDFNKYPIYITKLTKIANNNEIETNNSLDLYPNQTLLTYYQSAVKIQKFLTTSDSKLTVKIFFSQYDYLHNSLLKVDNSLIIENITTTFSKKTSPMFAKKYYLIGLQPPNYYFSSPSYGYVYGWKKTGDFSLLIFKSLGRLFSGNLNGFSGPVGIIQQLKMILVSYPQFLFVFIALISANLAILNVLIIPPLDGYRILETIIEKIIKKPLPEKLKLFFYFLGIILFLGLFVTLTIFDIIH